jgi:hypothetical protein
MGDLPDSARAVIEGAGLAHLVTLEPDGRPQVSIVWVGLEGGEIVCGHLPDRQRGRVMPRNSTAHTAATTRSTTGSV